MLKYARGVVRVTTVVLNVKKTITLNIKKNALRIHKRNNEIKLFSN